MKRLLSVLLVVSMFLSFAVPAAAEQADTVTSCGKTENCTLTDGHEGDCQQTQMLMMLDGAEDPDPNPQTNLPEEAGLYFVSGETYGKELSVTANTAAETLLMYFDGTALTAAADYTASEGLSVAAKEDVTGGVLITAAAAGSYTITYGESTVTVTATAIAEEEQEQPADDEQQPPVEPVADNNSGIPSGLQYELVMNGQPGYFNGNMMTVAKSMTAAFFWNGIKVTTNPGWKIYRVADDGTTTEDSSGLSMTLLDDGRWRLTALKSGKWELGHPDENLNGNLNYNPRIAITVNPANLNLNGSLEPGLYAGVNENNYYIYVSQTGLFHPGQMTFPMVFSDGQGTERALTADDLDDMYWDSDGLSLEHRAEGFWYAQTIKAGKHPITYTDPYTNKSYTLYFKTEVNLPMYVQTQEGGPWLDELVVTEGEPTVVNFAFAGSDGTKIPVEGTVNGSNGFIDVTRNMTTKKFTVTVNDWGGTYYANYFFDDYTCYSIPVVSQEAKRLAMVDLGSNSKVPVCDFIGEAGKTIQANFLFGLPSKTDDTGLKDVTDPTKLAVSSGLELTKNENASGYTLKIKETGDHTVTYQDADGKTYTVHITGMPASDGNNMLFALQGNSSAPQFTSVLSFGQIQDLRLCYGTFSNYIELEAKDLVLAGDSIVKSQNGPFVCLEYNKPGQTLLQYKVGDITHNYVVKCYGDYMEMLQTEYSEQGHRFTVNLPYGSDTVTVGFAWCNNTEMVMTGGNTFNEPADSEWPVTEEYVVGAMYAGPGHSVVAPAPKEFYDKITDMSLNFLSIRNTVANPDGEPNGTLSKANNTRVWNERNIWSSKFQGTPGLYFDSSMLMTFDITLENGTNRFYRTGELNYRPLPSQAAEVNIKDLKVLNTILSNSYVLINYLKDNVEGFTYDGGDLTLTLPAGNYNGILVSQILLPGSTDVLGTFRIQGSSEKGGTTVGGIYSKGFLHGVSNLNFHAMGNNSRITFDGETFTCGLFVNNTPTDFQPEFDFQTLWKYHPDFMRLSQKDAEEKFKTYNPSVPTESNSYNLGSITDCTFKGYDYAMRTDKGGFVQGSSGCTIEQCKYGVYINAGGMDTLHTDGRANTVWRNNRFIKNWMPVCITGLPNDLSPYYIRFIDNTFEKNRGDFWISFGDQDDQYYFQRNYYSGSWNDNYMPEEGWVLTDSDFWNTARSVTDTDTDTARAAVIVPGNAVVVTNPCRSQSDSTENLLIFDTDDQQHTSIFQSDADTMLVDPDSIGKLSRDLEIPVLNSEGKTVGSWTIEGGK